MKTLKINKEQAGEFFRNEVLFEDSRIDGYTIDDMVEILTGDEYQFISSQCYGYTIAVTAYKTSPDKLSSEVHTFVLPEHRTHATQALRGHVAYFKSLGLRHLFTTCSNYNKKVMNFLIKRLGFVVYDAFPIPDTRDGEPVTLYNLYKAVD